MGSIRHLARTLAGCERHQVRLAKGSLRQNMERPLRQWSPRNYRRLFNRPHLGGQTVEWKTSYSTHCGRNLVHYRRQNHAYNRLHPWTTVHGYRDQSRVLHERRLEDGGRRNLEAPPLEQQQSQHLLRQDLRRTLNRRLAGQALRLRTVGQWRACWDKHLRTMAPERPLRQAKLQFLSGARRSSRLSGQVKRTRQAWNRGLPRSQVGVGRKPAQLPPLQTGTALWSTGTEPDRYTHKIGYIPSHRQSQQYLGPRRKVLQYHRQSCKAQFAHNCGNGSNLFGSTPERNPS